MKGADRQAHTLPPDLIRRTREVWEPRYGHPLTDEDARQIVQNTVSFFRLLIAWDAEADAASDAETELSRAA